MILQNVACFAILTKAQVRGGGSVARFACAKLVFVLIVFAQSSDMSSLFGETCLNRCIHAGQRFARFVILEMPPNEDDLENRVSKTESYSGQVFVRRSISNFPDFPNVL